MQHGSDVRRGVMIEQPVELPYDLGTGGPLLPTVQGSRHSEGLGNPALESNLDSNLILSGQRHILQQKPHQSLALAVRSIRVLPYSREVADQGGDAGTLLVAGGNTIILATLFILPWRRVKCPELVIPRGIEGIGHKTIRRVHVKIASLGQIGFVAGSL